MKPLADQSSRDLIRTALDQTLVVEAAAGTGKTTELVHRIISILAEGRTTVDRIVAVTFTEKAAGELKLRIRERLERARADAGNDEERRTNLESALAHLEEARAGTIHSFCTDLLRERPMEAGVDPQFEAMDEGAAEQLYRQAFRAWLERVLEAPPEGVRRSLRRPSEDGPTERLQSAGWTLVQWRDFESDWERPQYDRIAEIDRLVTELHRFADLTRTAKDKAHIVYQKTRRARDFSDYIKTVEKSRGRDYDALESQLISLAKAWDFKIDRVGPAKYGDGVPRADVVAAHQVLVASLVQFGDRADADLAALLRSELRDSIELYETLKARAGKLDFLDLLVRARDLLRDNASVRRVLQERFSHIFIDEFQDTDPLQAEILLLLAADDPATRDWRSMSVVPGKLFIVGDPKQAIYRFRRADVSLYWQVKDLLVKGGATCVPLSTSFRSVPFIQNFVNAAFQPKMTGDRAALQADYVPLSPSREQDPDQPSIVALSVPSPYGKARLSGGAVEQSLPDAVGAWIDWLLKESGWMVTERGRGGRVPVEARHVCIMFRRFDKLFGGDVTRPYAEALQSRGVAHLLVGGKSYHEREEVSTIRTALSAIEWPDDTLSVFATLRGSLFAISDADLLAYRNAFGPWHPFRVPEAVPDSIQPVASALETLRELSRGRNYRPVSETITRLLDATRAHAGFAMRPGGEQALANVLHVAEMAQQYESAGATSFRRFVEQLIESAERGQQAEAAIYEESADGVRMMSVHRAKGLEFPVVILADITCKIAHADPSRYIDSQKGLAAVKLVGWVPKQIRDHLDEEHACDVAEGVRLAYVAATRARDVLVVPAIGDASNGGGPGIADEWWVAPVYPALYPLEERRHAPSRPKLCPDFGIDTVLVRPNNDPADDRTVKPGAHGFGNGPSAYSVVWWDPKTLDLGKAPSFSIRQQELLEKGSEHTIQQKLQEYRDWQEQRERLIATGSVPTLRVQTATEHARSEAGSQDEVHLVETAIENRPSGPRFGTLVHAVLATIPLDGDGDKVSACAQLQGRILGATAEEVEAAAQTVAAALQHSLMERTRIAALDGACYRELPLTLRLADGQLIEGMADLVFHEDGKWIVVDFKTDQQIASALDQYRRQVAMYAKAISKAKGGTSDAYLFRV
jgi:ATP-dependent exoDNAse (exonuclease V) beta subunit